MEKAKLCLNCTTELNQMCVVDDKGKIIINLEPQQNSITKVEESIEECVVFKKK